LIPLNYGSATEPGFGDRRRFVCLDRCHKAADVAAGPGVSTVARRRRSGAPAAWIDRAADSGFHFSITDLTIAALARELEALVWSLDGDFEVMEKLGLVRLYGEPRRA
jgi:hypothetical protein